MFTSMLEIMSVCEIYGYVDDGNLNWVWVDRKEKFRTWESHKDLAK